MTSYARSRAGIRAASGNMGRFGSVWRDMRGNVRGSVQREVGKESIFRSAHG